MFHVEHFARNSSGKRFLLHMKIKRRLPAALTLLLAAALCACVATPSKNGTVSSPSEISKADTVSSIGDGYLTAQQWLDTLDSYDYNGYRFSVATTQERSFVQDEEGSGLIGKAAYERNLLVESKYNIKIVEKLYAGDDLLPEQRTASLSGTVIGDIIASKADDIAVLADNGLLLNLYSLPYFDPFADYMDVQAVKDCTIANTMYAMYGTVYDIRNNLWATFYNKDVMNELSLADPYDLVISGKWTWDVFLDMANSAREGKFSGFASYFNGDDDTGLANAVWQSGGQKYLGDSFRDTSLTIDIDPDFAETVRSAVKNVTKNNKSRFSGSGQESIGKFGDGTMLFFVYEVAVASTIIDKECSWGILPMPKADESQEDYHCWVDPQAIAVAVASSTPDTERTGRILAAMCAASYETVGSALEQTYLNYYLSDNRSAVMLLNYVFGSVQIDPVHIYGEGMIELGKETYQIVLSTLSSSSSLKSKLMSSSNLTLLEPYLSEKFK